MEHTGKIFGIGFQKTGTSSLNAALAALGYKAAGGIRINHPKGVAIDPPVTAEKVLPVVLSRARQADAFSDNPWPLLYRELDKAFPGSKFILTVRDEDRWVKSAVRHFADTPNTVMEWIYGVPSPKGNEQRWREVYAAHNASVRAYFAKRPKDLLELDFETGQGWPELCTFLGKPIPQSAFPRDNTADERERKQKSFYRRLKSGIKNIAKGK